MFLAATASLDFETTTSYQLVIEARDQGTNPAALTGTTTLSVLVNGTSNLYLFIMKHSQRPLGRLWNPHDLRRHLAHNFCEVKNQKQNHKTFNGLFTSE